MKTILLLILFALAVTLPATAQLVAVTPYGANAEGLPADEPKTVRAIARAEDVRAGEIVMTPAELKAVTAKNRSTVKAVIAARPKPVEVETDEDKAKSAARAETGASDDVSALLKKIASLEARIAALEAEKAK